MRGALNRALRCCTFAMFRAGEAVRADEFSVSAGLANTCALARGVVGLHSTYREWLRLMEGGAARRKEF